MPFGFEFGRYHRIFSRKIIFGRISHKRRSSHYYVTTPIFYVNSNPHIGHLYTSVLADAVARFQRMKNPDYNLKFMTGTDEHGQKISLSAQENNIDEQKYCDLISKKYRDMFDRFNISYTDYLRTTEIQHKNTVTKLWNAISGKGYIYLDEHEGWYCISDETFVAEEHLLPEESPGIRYTVELNKPVHFVKELNYKFKLSEFQDDLIHWLKRDGIVKPNKFQKILRNMVETEKVMKDISVSRPSSRMSWGIPVPNDSSQNIYVWLDALTSYLTSSGYPHSVTHWPPDLQIIGKDILKFHGVYWPAFLLAAGLEPPNCILCHSHWLVDGKKMSKSLGNVIDPMNRADFYTTEGFRYFLLHEAVPHSDGNYLESKIKVVINSDLADKFGNFLNRCRSKALNPERIFPSYSPLNHSKYIENQARDLIRSLDTLPDIVFSHYENFEFNRGIYKIMATMSLANKFFEHATPWKLKDPDQKDHLRAIIHISMETLRICSKDMVRQVVKFFAKRNKSFLWVCGILLQPIIPEITKNLLDGLLVPEDRRSFDRIRPFSWQKIDKIDGDVTLPNAQGGLFQKIQAEKQI